MQGLMNLMNKNEMIVIGELEGKEISRERGAQW